MSAVRYPVPQAPAEPPSIARVICESPALLVAHLEQLGAKVVTPPATALSARGDGRYVARTQASVYLPARGDLPALHLIVADDPPPISAAEYRARVAARQTKRGEPC